MSRYFYNLLVALDQMCNAILGELTFEATSDTSVTLKLKGSDGTVRSVALTLA